MIRTMDVETAPPSVFEDQRPLGRARRLPVQIDQRRHPLPPTDKLSCSPLIAMVA